MSTKKHDSMTREQMLAMRDIKAAGQADPITEARRHEASFLRSMAAAGEDYAWIIANQAWLRLGFETFVDWYEQRVAPVAVRLGLRPAREQAKAAIEQAAAEQRALPPRERRPQRELAKVFGVSQPTFSRLAGDSNESKPGENAQVSDPLDQIPAAADASAAFIAEQTEDPTSEESDPVVPVAPSAPSAVPGVATDGAPAVQEESADSPAADGPERAGTGVTLPAPDLVETPIGPMPRQFAAKLDQLVPDPNPHREWQAAFLTDVFAAAKAMRGYTGAEIAAKADDQLRAEFAGFVADMDELLRSVAEAQIAAADNVVRLRRVQ